MALCGLGVGVYDEGVRDLEPVCHLDVDPGRPAGRDDRRGALAPAGGRAHAAVAVRGEEEVAALQCREDGFKTFSPSINLLTSACHVPSFYKNHNKS